MTTGVLHHYPRRFRWSSRPTGASLAIDGRNVGGVAEIMGTGRWSAWLYHAGRETEHRRHCDAKRAMECAAVTARETEETEIV